MPPEADNTRGVNEACSTSRTRCSLSLLLLLMFSVAVRVSVRGCVWVKDSDVNVHVKDVVTDWSYALAGFLVPMLFGVSPGQS